ncbi:MAG TPA: hypothetical protein GX693_01105, partial [Firmicutes bacterium]|nr:hypothetical protein [Bacillota bacterium]
MNKRKQSLTTREKVLLMVALAAVLGFLGWKFVFIPVQSQVKQLQAEREVLQAQVDRLEEKISRKAALEKEWREMKEERDRLSIVLPAQDQLPLVLGNLEELIGRYPVKLSTLRTGEFADQADSSGISFRAGFDGQDSSLVSLFEELERFPHLLITEEAVWKREEGKSP